MRYAVLILLLPLCACLDGLRPVKAYQQRATIRCEEHHSAEECKPLDYPACQGGSCAP
jgi:hypothetical protein